jgi:sugar phosphate isomerase/epimerase
VIDECRERGIGDRALRQRLRDAGVLVRVIDCIQAGFPGMQLSPTRFKGRIIAQEDQARCFAAAAAMEAPIVNVSPFGGADVAHEEVVEWVGELCREAETLGVTVSLEFMPGTAIPDLGAAQAIATACGAANCGAMLDTWHFARSGGSVEDIAKLPPGAIVAAALVNSPGVTADVEVFSEVLGALSADEAAHRTSLALAAWQAASAL